MGRPRSYTLNDNYFEKIDTNNKSYILGFIYADGSVSKKNTIEITISIKDIDIINFIIKEVEFTGKTKIITINNNQYVGVRFTSNKMISDLNKLGIIKNKTYESKRLPIVPKEFFNDMVRGFFDGDGSIHSNKRDNRSKEYTISFSSNISVLGQIKNYLHDCEISSSKIRLRHKDSIYSGQLEIRGSVNIEKFYKLIYTQNSFYLNRKHERFIEFLSIISKMNKRKQPKNQLNKIKELYLLGYTQKEIHVKLEIPFSTVRGTIQRFRKSGDII